MRQRHIAAVAVRHIAAVAVRRIAAAAERHIAAVAVPNRQERVAVERLPCVR